MERIVLEPPFSAKVLASICRNMHETNLVDPQDTVRWLLKMNDGARMRRAIRAAWMATTLPLCEWASRVVSVSAYTNETQTVLGLEVLLDTAQGTCVRQQAPFAPAKFETLCSQNGLRVPGAVRELALSAPSLRLENTGTVCCPWYFRSPLAYVEYWLDFLERGRSEHLGPFLPRQHLGGLALELANDGLGNCFIMGRDQRVYFFDHLECEEFQPCRVDATEFIQAYFANPRCVYDNDLFAS